MESKYDHITPVLLELHWLPIEVRIRYKIAVLTFKTITINKPLYLTELVSAHRSARELRSSSHNRLHIKRFRTVFGSRAFQHAAPEVWNSLPSELIDNITSLDTFKSHLKTYLYGLSFRR